MIDDGKFLISFWPIWLDKESGMLLLPDLIGIFFSGNIQCRIRGIYINHHARRRHVRRHHVRYRRHLFLPFHR